MELNIPRVNLLQDKMQRYIQGFRFEKQQIGFRHQTTGFCVEQMDMLYLQMER